MDNKNTKRNAKLLEISEEFYDLAIHLREEKFDFCAYVVEEAYRFYMAALEKELFGKEVN